MIDEVKLGILIILVTILSGFFAVKNFKTELKAQDKNLNLQFERISGDNVWEIFYQKDLRVICIRKNGDGISCIPYEFLKKLEAK